jgi:hypothetical protein
LAACGGLAQERLELGGSSIGFETRAVGRQVEERGAGRFDRLADAIDLVRRQLRHSRRLAETSGRSCSAALNAFLCLSLGLRSVLWIVESPAMTPRRPCRAWQLDPRGPPRRFAVSPSPGSS